MTSPTVTEKPPAREPVVPDPFIADVEAPDVRLIPPPDPPAPRRRRIVD